MRNKGFSLVEVLSSIVIVGVAVVSILEMYTLSAKVRIQNQQNVIGYNLLHQKAEETKSKSFVNIIDTAGTFTTHSGFGYSVVTTFPYDPNSEGVSMKRVDVSVNWQNSFGGTYSKAIYFIATP